MWYHFNLNLVTHFGGADGYKQMALYIYFLHIMQGMHECIYNILHPWLVTFFLNDCQTSIWLQVMVQMMCQWFRQQMLELEFLVRRGCRLWWHQILHYQGSSILRGCFWFMVTGAMTDCHAWCCISSIRML